MQIVIFRMEYIQLTYSEQYIIHHFYFQIAYSGYQDAWHVWVHYLGTKKEAEKFQFTVVLNPADMVIDEKHPEEENKEIADEIRRLSSLNINDCACDWGCHCEIHNPPVEIEEQENENDKSTAEMKFTGKVLSIDVPSQSIDHIIPNNVLTLPDDIMRLFIRPNIGIPYHVSIEETK